MENILTSFTRGRFVTAFLQLPLKTQVDYAVGVDDAKKDSIAQKSTDHYEKSSSTAIRRLMLHFRFTWLLNFRRHYNSMIGVICQKRFCHDAMLKCLQMCLDLS